MNNTKCYTEKLASTTSRFRVPAYPAKGKSMTSIEQSVSEKGNQAKDDHTGDGVYHVNNRDGRVAARGEDLTGHEILSRAGFSAEKYELFELIDGKAGPEIPPDVVHHVKPGQHYRATIRGTDYSALVRQRT
jgi:hypothetical protein